MLILLYGDDTFRSCRRLQQLRDAFRKKFDAAGLNMVRLDGETLKPEQFNEQFAASGFLSAKRFLSVSNLLSKGSAQTLAAVQDMLAERNFTTENILVFWESAELAAAPARSAKGKKLAGTALLESVRALAKVEHFPLLSPVEVEQWIVRATKHRAGNIEKKAASKLAAAVGADLWTASAELDKLLHFADGHLITERDVDQLVAAPFDESMFRLTDALGQRDVPAALRFLEEHFVNGTDPLAVLRMLAWHLRNVVSVRGLLDQGIQQPAAIARECHMHPYVAQKTVRQAALFTMEELRNAYTNLLQVEQACKSSRSNPKALLDLFAAQFRKTAAPLRSHAA